MKGLFATSVVQVIISMLSGIAVFLLSWVYLNSYYTLEVEDNLYRNEALIIHKLFKQNPKINKQFVFISTGKDLSLVDDTASSGNLVVSNRYKLLKLLQAVNAGKVKPKFILLDLQFYYPFNLSVDDSIKTSIKKDHLQAYFADKAIDDSLQAEINKDKNLAISVLYADNKIQTPIYKANYGIADYKTYGGQLNKFRLNYPELHASSIPCLMTEQMDGTKYTGGEYDTFCNGHLCFNYIWPGYYYDQQTVKSDTSYQLYHIGSMVDLPNYAQVIERIVKDKVVFIGNFEDDVHDTPAGKIPGTIVLADIYLSLLNGNHYVPYLWIVFMILVFSILSYTSVYNKLPKMEFDFGVAFNFIYTFFSEYFSYLGILLLLSLISVLVFNINISLFLPAFIFSAIDFFHKKKYKKPKHE